MKKSLTLVFPLVLLAIFYFFDEPERFALPPAPTPISEEEREEDEGGRNKVVNNEREIPDGFLRVVRVVDGDTLVIEENGIEEKVRMIGLDTPEVVDPRKPVQCFGREASAKAKEILEGKFVRLESDESQGDRDKYGRLLRYAFLEDGRLFNKLMVEEGYGHEYTYNIPYKYQKEFQDAEASAREGKKGLWAEGVCE